jgi:hypothetical protein
VTTDAEILARLAAIEQQNQQVLSLLAKLAEAQPVELPTPSRRRRGKYSEAQWQALVRDPDILREMSKQDTSKRRKKTMAATSSRQSEAQA